MSVIVFRGYLAAVNMLPLATDKQTNKPPKKMLLYKGIHVIIQLVFLITPINLSIENISPLFSALNEI